MLAHGMNHPALGKNDAATGHSLGIDRIELAAPK